MKIKDALPHIFQRAYPAIDPKTPMLSALSLLRFHEIDALPLSFDAETKHRAIFGFSCLARLMKPGPRGLPGFLEEPCEKASEPIATIQATRTLASLLDRFAKTQFGFARVEEKSGVGALVGLSEILGLFSEGVLETELEVKDVASPIFSVPGSTPVKEVLSEMFGKRFRRVFISGTREFVWDRSIIDQVFSPAVLGTVTKDSGAILGAPISEFRTTAALDVSPDATLKDAAGALTADKGQCLAFKGMLVTPWDVVIKPWQARALKAM